MSSRLFNAVILLVVACPFILHDQTVYGQADRRKIVKKQMAFTAATTSIQSEIKSLGESKTLNDAIVAGLQQEMTNNVVVHRHTKASRARSDEYVRSELRNRLKAKVEQICEEKDLSLNEVRGRMENLDQTMENAVKRHMASRTASDYFSTARNRAVQDQGKSIDFDIDYPKQYDIEDKLDERNFRQELIEKLVGQTIPPGRAIFEENDTKAREVAENVADDIDLEYRNQKQVLRESSEDEKVPPNHLTRDEIGSFLLEKLKEYCAQEERQGVPIYTTLKPLRKLVSDRAENLEATRFGEHLKTYKFPAELREFVKQNLRNWVKSQIDSHKEPRKSRDTIVKNWLPRAMKYFVDHYVQPHTSDEQQKAKYLARFTQLIQEDNRSLFVQRRFEDYLDSFLPDHRLVLANEQVTEHFDAMAKWQPAEATVYHALSSDTKIPTGFDDALRLLEHKDALPPLIQEA